MNSKNAGATHAVRESLRESRSGALDSGGSQYHEIYMAATGVAREREPGRDHESVQLCPPAEAQELLAPPASTHESVAQLSLELLKKDDELTELLTELAAAQSYEQQQQESSLLLQARLAEYEAQLGEVDALLTDLHAQLKNKNELLHWITRSRSWQMTTWVRRLNFLTLKMRPWPRRFTRNSFHGLVEQPSEGARVSGLLEISGWVYSDAAPVVRVEAFLDTISLGTLRYGNPRVAVIAQQSPAPVNCKYEGTFLIDKVFAGPRTLTVRVTDRHGHIKDFNRAIEVAAATESAAFTAALSAPPREKKLAPAPATEPAQTAFFRDPLATAKGWLTSLSKISLESFLLAQARIKFPVYEHPTTSIVVVLYNRAELTLQCLRSILQSNQSPYEVIIVNNASTDETAELLRLVEGARIIDNPTNVHYLRACNQAAAAARGEYLLLLNNDAQVQGDSIATAIEVLNSATDIGAVGGKVILPHGALQEAGSIIWQDGSCLGYGRGDAPFAPQYMFRRDVDYCSGVFLLTRRELFQQLGGFDEAFAPAYYEETDYCVRLWQQGKRVVYDPHVSVLHYEFASATTTQSALELQTQHRHVFNKKHAAWVQAQPPNAPEHLLSARAHRRPGQKRILYIDDRVPHGQLGSGFPRSNRILTELVGLGHFVTCYPSNFPHEEWAQVYRDVPREVEVILDRGRAGLESFLLERANYYDLIFISRPHNFAFMRALMLQHPQLFATTEIIYDAEALFSLREIERLRVKGKRLTPEQCKQLLADEIGLMANCHAVISVSAREQQEIIKHGCPHVHTLGHTLAVTPTPQPFATRRDILFIGAIHDLDSPNADSVLWFTKKVWPLIQKQLGPQVKFLIAGHDSADLLGHLHKGQVQVLGSVADLTALYDNARLFVAPTRFSAGIPHKVHEAAAHGLPLVATPLIGAQLDWHDGAELLIADDAENFAAACVRLYTDEQLWQQLRHNALARIATDCSPAAFTARLRTIID